MEHGEKIVTDQVINNDIGFVLWKLESIEKFFPCYQSLIKRKDE